MINHLTAEQQRRNVQCRHSWERYATHRDRVTQLVIKARRQPSQRELCVLGAGNVNDLDLQRLLDDGWQMHLVDIDESALREGVARQGLHDDPRIAIHGPVDVTGCLQELCQLDRSSSLEVVREITTALGTSRPTYEVPAADVVLSTGLLSQLVEIATLSISSEHVGFVELVQALRLQHLRMLAELTRPKGTMILTSEVVSSTTAPQLLTTTEQDLPSVLSLLLLQGNFFSGLHPGLIGQTLQTDPVLSEQIEHLQVEGPWLWDFVARTYAVCAFVGHKASGR